MKAPRLAAKTVADAHPQADKIRQVAHGTLEVAHAEAVKTIAGKQEEAKQTRQDAQTAARVKETEAATKVTEARADAVETRRIAQEQAQEHLTDCQKQSDGIIGPAKTNLEAKRQELQNS